MCLSSPLYKKKETTYGHPGGRGRPDQQDISRHVNRNTPGVTVTVESHTETKKTPVPKTIWTK